MYSTTMLLLPLLLVTLVPDYAISLSSTQSPLKNEQPTYIDTSSVCPKLYYSNNRVVQNCSSLNLANADWTVQSIDAQFVSELLLASNNFQASLPHTHINQYQSLTLLDLSANQISQTTLQLTLIDCDTNPFIEFLFSNNRFTSLPLLANSCMRNIQKLTFSHNKQLFNLDSTFGLQTMPKLEYLDVSYCSIQQIGTTSVLTQMPLLQSLNLIGNQIKTISNNAFSSIPYLNYLSFEDNNLFCDNSILWIKTWLSNKNTRICCDDKPIPPINPPILDIRPPNSEYSPTCFSPLTLAQEQILTFPSPLFLIYMQLNTSVLDPYNIKVTGGDIVELDCSLTSRPGADLWWTFNDRVLSKVSSRDSPYEFIENFDASNNKEVLNKTSVLRIKKSSQELQGKYTCSAFYLNYKPNQYLSIASQGFQVSVQLGPVLVGHPWLAWQIALLVLGCLLAFLLLCLLTYCCVWCCCFRGSPFCCCCLPCCACLSSRKKRDKRHLSGIMTSSSSHDLRYDLRTTRNNITDTDENQSGFKEQTRKPNYVINTISKGSTLVNNNNIQSASNSHLTKTSLLNQLQQQDLIDINMPCEDTKVYNTQAPQQQQQTRHNTQHRPQVYSSINNPVDYGSTYNTNEAYLNDNVDLHQVRFSTDVIINDQMRNEEYDSFNPNHREFGKHNNNQNNQNNFGSFSKEVVNFSSNYTHEVNNTSFVKYDSDV